MRNRLIFINNESQIWNNRRCFDLIKAPQQSLYLFRSAKQQAQGKYAPPFFLSSNSTLQNLQHYISTSAFKYLTIMKAQQFLSKFPFIPIAPCQFRYLPQVISVRLHNSAHDWVPCKVLREGISYFRVKARHNLCHVHVLDVGTMHSWNCNLKMHIAHSRTSNQIRSWRWCQKHTRVTRHTQMKIPPCS